MKAESINIEVDYSSYYWLSSSIARDTARLFNAGFLKGKEEHIFAVPLYRNGAVVGCAKRQRIKLGGFCSRTTYDVSEMELRRFVFRINEASREAPNVPLVILQDTFDVMGFWQKGVKRAVAILSEALSDEQVSMLHACLGSKQRALVIHRSEDRERKLAEEVMRHLARFAYVRVMAAEEFSLNSSCSW